MQNKLNLQLLLSLLIFVFLTILGIKAYDQGAEKPVYSQQTTSLASTLINHGFNEVPKFCNSPQSHTETIGISKSKLGTSHFCSVSPSPYPTLIIQPDNNSFQAYVRRVDNIVYLETLDGYTIMKDPDDGHYRFASRGTKGNLALTRLNVTSVDQRDATALALLTGLTKHLRYEGDKLAEFQSSFDENGPERGEKMISAAFPATGVQRALVLLIDYPDQPHLFSVQDFDNLYNQPGYDVSGSFKEYFFDVSGGLLTINTDVLGWYTATHNRAHYGMQSNFTFTPARELVREAVAAAEAGGLDFSLYDGNDDGDVDVVSIVHSGVGGESSGDTDDIWSHRSSLGGSLTYDGKRINDFIIQPEKRHSTEISNIGVFAHEFGHALGLPDLYDSNTAGLGNWCLMAFGTFNNYGRTPAHPSAWCKEQLGWITPTVLTGTGSITDMVVSQSNAEVYRMNIPSSSEYFLLENRSQTGWWDTYVPGNGLMIYHIDPTRSSNNNENRRRVDIEQADNNRDLNTIGGNRGDAGDTYPGSSNNTEFNCVTSPASTSYDSNDFGVSISNISLNSNSNLISFDYVNGNCGCAGASNDADNDGVCAADDPNDNDPCVPNESGPNCSLNCTIFDSNSFESGLGIWNDGGSNCVRLTNSNFAYTGTSVVRLRNKSGVSSSMFTNTLDLSGVEELNLSYVFIAKSMEVGENFFIEISTDGGSTYSVLKDWIRGTNFVNNQFYLDAISLVGQELSSNTRFRIRCDASGNNDKIFIDDVVIETCSYGGASKAIIVATDVKDVVREASVLNNKNHQDDNLEEALVFPNPVADFMVIRMMTDENVDYRISVKSLLGQPVSLVKLKGSGYAEDVRLDCSRLSSGVYIVELFDQKHSVVKTIVVQ